jgi:hypothetical protein
MNKMKKHVLFFVLLASSFFLQAQSSWVNNGNFYLAWGYNEEWYSNSNIHVVQPALNSDFTYQNIQARDHIGWNYLFQDALTIPQYNYRIGYYFNEKQDLGIELNFDHTKYVVYQGQTDHVSGRLNGRNIDTSLVITQKTLEYQLNNGANFFLFNLVKKVKFISSREGAKKKTELAGIGRIGIGPVVPHVQDIIFGNPNAQHFQLGGWNTGIEAGIRLLFLNHVYLEFTNKIDYARYFDLRVYDGLVNQNFFTYELILTLGYTFHSHKATVSPLPPAGL